MTFIAQNIAVCLCLVALIQAAPRLVPIGPGFWNVHTPFVINGVDVGTQMSLIRLRSGNFLVLDTVQLDPGLQAEIDALTSNGTRISAVIATHPFHTVFFPDFFKQYPKPAYYGTPRHLKVQPSLPWAGSTYNCVVRQFWSPEVRMRIPRGAPFEAPAEDNHFSGIHVYHTRSKTIHVDDTITVNFPSVGDMGFHPTLTTIGLFHIPQAPNAYRDFVQKFINDWDFVNIVAAHNGTKVGGAKDQLRKLLSAAAPIFLNLTQTYAKSPVPTDQLLFQEMQRHESRCRE